MADMAFIRNHATPRIRFETAPVYNALCSFCLLIQDHLDHISPWVDSALAKATAEDREAAMLVCDATDFVSMVGGATIEEFITNLEVFDPSRFAVIQGQRVRIKALRYLDGAKVPTADTLSKDRKAFLSTVEQIYEKLEHEFDREKYERYFDRIHQGKSYRTELVKAIRRLWENLLRDEWPRVEPAVSDSVQAFRSVEIEGDDLEAKLKFITQRDNIPEEWLVMLKNVHEVTYVPSVHIGPYMTLLDFDGSNAVIVGRARIPEGAPVSSPTIDRSDLLIRLEALSDTTRLRILEMAAKREVITSQDVIDELELSQSSASRHLTQLTATGLLKVDGSERTRRYRLNSDRIDAVCGGIKQLFAVAAGV